MYKSAAICNKHYVLVREIRGNCFKYARHAYYEVLVEGRAPRTLWSSTTAVLEI